jgi:hypothetical protein
LRETTLAFLDRVDRALGAQELADIRFAEIESHACPILAGLESTKVVRLSSVHLASWRP